MSEHISQFRGRSLAAQEMLRLPGAVEAWGAGGPVLRPELWLVERPSPLARMAAVVRALTGRVAAMRGNRAVARTETLPA